MVFATLLWLFLMLVIAPLAGLGMLAQSLGPVFGLSWGALLLAFGATLGLLYGEMQADDMRPAAIAH